MHQELIDFDHGRAGYYPLEVARDLVGPEQWPEVERQLRGKLYQLAKPNYYLFQ